ncbi:MAG: DUF2163 domain-containing protein [Rhodobacteraceae bacterium]|nr:DUF2163 domain-containing protein [Paracoccaceae bacterium]
MSEALNAHLAQGLTTLARAWRLVRPDGKEFGFTDHDEPLNFEDLRYEANGGLTATALLQTSGLSIDNSEALGALSDARITEADINAGLYDGAEVIAWLVNWADVSERKMLFRGFVGEIRRGDGAFTAELRGLTEALNEPQGRTYLKTCSELGLEGVDLAAPGYRAELAVEEIEGRRLLRFADLPGFDPDWFERGRLDVLTGAAKGLWGAIKWDRQTDAGREIELWMPLRGDLQPGDLVRLEVGADGTLATTQLKFDNAVNFTGFPYIPGEDWLSAVPVLGGSNDGGALQ